MVSHSDASTNIIPKSQSILHHTTRCFVIAQLQNLHLSSSFNGQLLNLKVPVSHYIPCISPPLEFRSFSTSRIDPKSNADYFSINNLFQTVNLVANMPDMGTPDKETMKCQIYPRVHQIRRHQNSMKFPCSLRKKVLFLTQ